MTNYHLNRLAVAVLAFVITLYPIVCRSATARLDDGTTISYHQTLTAANSAIASGSNVTITAQAGTFRESLNLDRGAMSGCVAATIPDSLGLSEQPGLRGLLRSQPARWWRTISSWQRP